LDAIGFNWDDERGRDNSFFARVDELKAFKVKHGHLKVRQKEDQSLYGFCCNMRQARRDVMLGKGKRCSSLMMAE
jgi:hypothetical protein